MSARLFDDVMALAKRRGFLWPSFEIYGGIGGFYDYGPLGAELKRNILSIWREMYVLEEGFMEIDTPTVAPREVFKASGHVDEFKDVMVTCSTCGQSFRAEALLGAYHPNPGVLGTSDVDALIAGNGIVCRTCGGDLGPAVEFNLMFRTDVGPGKGRDAYLRPETAQGIFVNFHLLYRIAREKLPMGVVQVGRGYRNEIAPRQGPIRLREFTMAEAEVFMDPEMRGWPGFDRISDLQVRLMPAGGDEIVTTLAGAVENGIICSQTVAYFVGRTHQFLTRIGIDPERLRYRQHERREMAHYAEDCWDAEARISFGWVELVGIADRSAYDLNAHMKDSGTDLQAQRRLPEPVVRRVKRVIPDLARIGRRFREMAPSVVKGLRNIPIGSGDVIVDIDGQEITVPAECYRIEEVEERVNVEKFTPRVVEPSYGIDRIFYTVLEHSYREEVRREGERVETFRVLSLPPEVAPIKFGVFPLVAREPLTDIARSLDKRLRCTGIMTYYDESGSIGRRYARMDEAGTPFCITVDYDSPDDGCVTIRERDTRNQIRTPIDGMESLCSNLIKGQAFSKSHAPC